MTDRSTDEIRNLMGRAMSNPPAPHPWADVERRASDRGDSPPVRRRTRAWLAAAACLVAVVGGLAVVVGSDDDSKVRIDGGPDTTTPPTPTSTPAPIATPVPTTTPAPTSVPAPTTTLPEAEPGWTSGLLDDIDEESLRPLDSFTEGDVIVPTAPSGWRVSASGSTDSVDLPPGSAHSYVNIFEARPIDDISHMIDLALRREPICVDSRGCTLSGTSVTINGVVWESFTEVGAGIRASLGDRWIEVFVPRIEVATDGESRIVHPSGPLLDDPTVIEYLEGLRVGSPADLAAVGAACWDCDRSGSDRTDDEPVWPVRLDAIDSDGLRPLDTMSPGDVLIPTAPPDWILSENQIEADNPELPVTIFTARTGSRLLEVYVAPVCDADETSCPMGDNGFTIGWPLTDAIDVDGVTWGYPPGAYGAAATVLGDYVVAIAGTWFESRIPLLDEPDVVAFIQGLRVASLTELPEQIVVVDERGTPIVD